MSGNATLTVNGTFTYESTIGSNASSTTVTLSGGTLAVDNLAMGTQGSSPATQTGNIQFAGGLLEALANDNTVGSALFLPSNAYLTANVDPGGANINSNGHSITISQALLHGGTLTLDGGLTQSGGGSLVLSGLNTYTGSTVVGNGTVVANIVASGAVA